MWAKTTIFRNNIAERLKKNQHDGSIDGCFAFLGLCFSIVVVTKPTQKTRWIDVRLVLVLVFVCLSPLFSHALCVEYCRLYAPGRATTVTLSLTDIFRTKSNKRFTGRMFYYFLVK